MLVANYTARSGLIAQQQRMDIIANNIANANTVGFNSTRADFKDMLYQTQVRVEQPQDGLNMQKGHGVLLGATTHDFHQGSAQLTGLQLDFYLSGDGFFNVQDVYGNVRYTRDGSFALSVEDDGNYLVNQSGHYVLNTEGQRINLQDVNESKVEVEQDGTIFIVKVTPATDTAPATSERIRIGQFAVSQFMNRKGLSAEPGNLFTPTENSGEAVPDTTTTIVQGTLEMSNVELSNEMVRMIRTQRALSLAARVLTTANEMDGQAIQMRR